MENNLDDILVDNPENQSENDGVNTHSKRNILMGVASALLVGVVGLTLYFVVFKDKEVEVKGLEVTHSELEQFTLPEQQALIETQKENLQESIQENAQENTQEVKVDDEFDKLIAELKQVENDQEVESAKTQSIPQAPVVEENTVQMSQNNDALNEAIVIEDEIEPNQQEIQSVQVAQPQEMQMQNVKQETKEQDEKMQKQSLAKQEPAKQDSAKQDSVKQEPAKQNLATIQDNSNHPQTSVAQDKSLETEGSQKIESSSASQTKVAKPKEQKSQVDTPKVASTNQTKATAQAFDSLEQKIPQGFYLQVGVFSKTPNADFLKKLEGLSYKVQKFDSKGKVVNRYLVGGFKSRAEAQAQIDAITKRVAKPVIVEIR